jgi:aspartate racemase
LSANTPHIVFDDVRARSPLPLVSIVESTCQAASALHLTRVGLLGTRFTMQARFYPDVFCRAGIELVVPQPDEQRYVHDKYVTELVNGTVLSDTHDGLVRIIQSLRERDGAEAVILAGTELPLILTEAIVAGIPLLDTARIHVHAAAERLWR